ncbi:MAG: hypothetical protein HRU27_19810 [Rhizobiaceae bacterium]|nr:hypothetical protein [Hyphomicrobiales bacterium]NRB32839.1 hypothetical protein [Rhizobiaceae bacterium]
MRKFTTTLLATLGLLAAVFSTTAIATASEGGLGGEPVPGGPMCVIWNGVQICF